MKHKMKPTNIFSRIAVIGYSLYLVVEMIIYPLITKVPPLLSTILNIIYITSFIAVAAWIISHDKSLKKPATFIIIAAALCAINRILTYYFQMHHQMADVKSSLITTSIYIPALIFKCKGFFKLAKGLPQGNIARYMAKVIPWTELPPLITTIIFSIIMSFTTIPSIVLRMPSTIMFLTEILAMAILCYYLPKAIEHKEELQ